MAKGLRSSTKKANKANLRRKVFGPVEVARKERLSSKLLELASSSKPQHSNVEDTEMGEGQQAAFRHEMTEMEPEHAVTSQEMDVDTRTQTTAAGSKPRSSGRIQKKIRRKASASMIFTVYKKGKRVRIGKK